MEMVQGTDVSRMIASSGRLPPEHVHAIAAHVCDALAYAHGNGLIHRDIKPANIMVDTQGRVKVADFGLAKAVDAQTGFTQSNMAVGTPDFVAPEALIPGMPVDGRADLYAVGVMLYQMLTGQVPRGAFKPASVVVPGIDRRFDDIVLKAMQVDREERHHSATELRQHLDTLLMPAVPAPDLQRYSSAGMPKQAVPMPERQTSFPTRSPSPGGVAAKKNEADKNVRSTMNPAAVLALKDGITNTLGMKFLPVKGTDVLFCIHETRRQDYAAYAAEAPGVDGSWKDQTCDGYALTENKENHPVIRVSWEDAQKFCAWLSKKEGKLYRLPTDQEWSYAVGIGRDEKWKKDTTPATVFKSQTDFPWGDKWPPPKGSGNYSDDSRKAKAPNATAQYLENYDDGFPTTAPVMSFKPNKLGLYDLEGNVREWVEDWWDNAKADRVLRGGSWNRNERGLLLSSSRFPYLPGSRHNDHGFRCVVVVSGG